MGIENAVALERNIVVLTGGVGGAKLASGLLDVAPAERLTFVVNTGDDFWHLGLRICPDLDTTMYTLAGLVEPAQGWGLRDDSTVTLDALGAYYGLEPWFKLGDKDLATHLLRGEMLRRGVSLTEITAGLSRKLGIGARLLPMCDAEMPTIVETAEYGELGFQEYFVKHRWQPAVKAIRYQGGAVPKVSDAVASALTAADIVLIAPSNPWLSVGPILAVPGMRDLLFALDLPKVAVTPIIGGDAVKGPTAKIMRELGLQVTAATIVEYYHGVINGFVDDLRNEPGQFEGLRAIRLDTLMQAQNDKRTLAEATLNWIAEWHS